MEQSGLIERGCKVILLFEKALMEESQNNVLSIIIQQGPFCYNFVGA